MEVGDLVRKLVVRTRNLPPGVGILLPHTHEQLVSLGRSMSEKWDNKSMSLVLAIWPIVGLVNTV